MIKTGFEYFDETIHDLEKYRLILIGERPNIGKTAFVVSLARNIAVDQQIPMALFSLELSSEQVLSRVTCNVCRLDYNKVINGQLSDKEKDFFASTQEKLKESPLYIDDSKALSVSDFACKLRNTIKEHKVKVVIVDYLQLMKANKNRESSKQESTYVLKCLRKLADELHITIVLMSLLQRRRKRTQEKPTLHSLKAMVSSFDKYAELAALIYVPDYYYSILPDIEMKENNSDYMARIMIETNHFGPKKSFLLFFNIGACRLYNRIV